ncbi:hypothetical protein BDZ89DRAFT_955797 [Hymenopellis radicata]|nr:hypothetical protein BDZ89DRAFT_955797 [Hymenopellis radicata]
MSTEPQGLVTVLAENGTAVSEERFNDWYDNEHAPLRLTVDGYLTAIRYKATDEQKPSWLTLYDLSTPEDANCPAYLALRNKASAEEEIIMPSLQSLSRRVYQQIGVYTHPSATPASFPGKFVLMVGLEVTREGEDELNKWYDEEHMGMLQKIPGWLGGRRYTLLSEAARGDAQGKAVCKYLAIHELDNDDYTSHQAFKDATSTPWRAEVMKNVTGKELRMYKLHKLYERPQ